jgi:[ribosomal protein S18]-alanine N-acetyltransferase
LSGAFLLRPLGAPDLDIAARLHREAFLPMGERAWPRQEMASLLASPGVAGLLLQRAEKEIGFAVCRTVADEAELLTIAVSPGARRRGAGGALLRAVIDLARARNACRLFLEVGDDNPAARILYERTGFETVGRRVAYYRRGDRPAADALLMRLALV